MAIVFWICIVLAAMVDRVTKALAERYIFGKEEIIKIGDTDILYFSLTHNTGAAFSSFSGRTALLSVFTVIALAAMVVYFYRCKTESLFKTVTLAMIVGGGLGNLYDRIAFGMVTDFINLFPFNFVFNFADICVVIGAILLTVYMIFFEKEPTEKQTAEEGSE